MKVKVKLKELTNPDLRFVSLVKRGANRIPFRITKAEKEQKMGSIDLAHIGSMLKLKAAQSTPVVAGIVVAKGDAKQFAAVTKAVADSGFKADEIKDLGEGAVMFVQLPEPDKGAHVVRLSDSTVVCLKDFSPFEEKLAANVDFEPALKQDGFYQGVGVATLAYSKAMGALLQKGDSAEAVAKVTEKFNAYVSTLVEGIPANAFKMDKAVTDAVTANPVAEVKKASKPTSMAQDKWDAMSDDDKAIAASTADDKDPDGDGDDDYAKKTDAWKVTHKDAITAEPVRDGSSPNPKVGTKPEGISDEMWNSILVTATAAVMAVTGGTAKGDDKTPGKKEDEKKEDVKKEETKVDPALAALTETVNALALAMKGVVESVKETKTKAEATEARLKGTVLTDTTQGDRAGDGGTDQVRDWEGDGWVTDTAVQKRTAKYDRAVRGH